MQSTGDSLREYAHIYIFMCSPLQPLAIMVRCHRCMGEIQPGMAVWLHGPQRTINWNADRQRWELGWEVALLAFHAHCCREQRTVYGGG